MKRLKRFSKINIEISNICNLQCSFCPEVIREKKLMGLDTFENIISQVGPLTEQVCLHLMGDPLVHPKWASFIEICEAHKVRVFFVTNGTKLNDESFEPLLSPCVAQVNFSLHSFNDNFPKSDPSRYLENIFRFTELAFTRRPDLYINYRLWNLADPRGGDSSNRDLLQKICDKYRVRAPVEIDVRKKKSFKLLNRLYFHFDTEFVWPSLEAEFLGTKGRCHGLSSHFGILVDGTVVPCCLDKEAAIPLGNISKTSIVEILASPRAMTILNGFRKGQLVENLCQHCQYIERFASPER